MRPLDTFGGPLEAAPGGPDLAVYRNAVYEVTVGPRAEPAPCQRLAPVSVGGKLVPSRETRGARGVRFLVWRNAVYRVGAPDDAAIMRRESTVQLTIDRSDGGARMDCAVMQELRNLTAGPEEYAVQVFPSEARLQDTSNTFHLWLVPSALRARALAGSTAVRVRRLDGGRVTDWRHVQRVKNALLGADAEAWQEFPAEPTDAHRDGSVTLVTVPRDVAVGLARRLVLDVKMPGGGAQRAFPEGLVPPDVSDPAKMREAFANARRFVL